MARRTSVTIVLLAILAGAWVSQAAAQAEDPAVAELAAYKNKKHEKHGKYDKDTKYEHKYDKDTKYEHKYDKDAKYEHKYEKKTDSYKKYHDKPSYSGDKSYYEDKSYSSGEYSSGETGYSGYSGEYSSGEYSTGPSTGPTDSPKGPKFISFEVQLGDKVLERNGLRKRSLLQDAPRKLAPQASIQSDWRDTFPTPETVNVYCTAEVSYDSYKHDEDKSLTPIGTYVTAFTKAMTEKFTKCYGHTAKILGEVKGELVINADADDCDEDLVKDNIARTEGDIAAIPALLKLPKHLLAAEAQVMYQEYYDDRAHAVCGMAFLFNGTAGYGTPAFWTEVGKVAPVTDTTKYAYWGYAEYVAGFNGRLISTGAKVELPQSIGGPDDYMSDEQWKELKHKCKEHRGVLPIVNYGKIEFDLRRFTWKDAAAKIEA